MVKARVITADHKPLDTKRLRQLRIHGKVLEATEVETDKVYRVYRDVLFVDHEGQEHKFNKVTVPSEIRDLLTNREITFYMLKCKHDLELWGTIYAVEYGEQGVVWPNETMIMLQDFGQETYLRYHYKWWIIGFAVCVGLGLDHLYDLAYYNSGILRYIIPDSIWNSLIWSAGIIGVSLAWPYAAGSLITKSRQRLKALKLEGFQDREQEDEKPGTGWLGLSFWEPLLKHTEQLKALSDSYFEGERKMPVESDKKLENKED